MEVKTSKGPATIFYQQMGNKKYGAITPKGKVIFFGDNRYQQYKDRALGLYKKLDHNDIERRKKYRIRHRNDNYNDPEYPSYYSWRYLW